MPPKKQAYCMKRTARTRNRRRGSTASTVPAYKDPALAPEKRVKDLLARMTLEEKAAQMMCVWQEKAQKLVDAEGNFDPAKAKAAFKKGPRPRPGGPPQRRRRAGRRAVDGAHRPADGRADQRHPEVLPRKLAPRHSGRLSRGMPARPRGPRRHQLSASPSGWAPPSIPTLVEAAVHHDGLRGPRARHAPGAHARWWTWRAIRAGAAWRKPTARIPI